MEKISGIIFDMDGLILDTEAIYCECNVSTAPKYGLKGFDKAYYKEEIGLSEEHAYQKYLSDFDYVSKESIDGFYKESRQKVKDIFDTSGAPLKPGVIELLDYLKEQDIPCVVASSNTTEMINQLLSKANLLPYFKGIVSGDEVTHAKPHPEIVEVALEKLGSPAAETVMLEDSLNGIRASFTAGVPVIMVPDLLEPTEEAIEKTHRIKADLFEVLAYIQKTK
ncbi:HAD family hydrolase [Vagococcus fluvialis]|uniref:HAD family hydrolase n=1 Tax=Vagococcus fluvialis TaxID=2738 RepID=UPI003B5A30CA